MTPTQVDPFVRRQGRTEDRADLSIVTAGAVLAMAIPVVVTLALPRYFIKGILGGAVKG